MLKLPVRQPASQKRGRAAAEMSRQQMASETGRPGISNGYVEWHIPAIERVSVREFENMLIEKFGPEYLQPVDYRWVEGKLAPDVIEGER